MNTLSQHIKHRLSFIRLALLGSLMLVTSATMAQGGGSTPHVTVGGNVFGGGNLANVLGKSTVTVDQANATMTDVYGGGALANVGSSADDTTTVNILQGVISGNVYGGGLGDSTAIGYDGNANVAALVHGKVFVNIGAAPVAPSTNPTGNATIGGSVFGCNNINGTPLDSVFVNIFKTAHTTENTYPTAPSGGWTAATLEASYATPQEYALTAVYGGGNKASYKPSVANRATTVHIYYCSENTIETAYGGGNAADVGTPSKHANTRLIIDGGCYDHIFGGGNGYSIDGNHNNPSSVTYNPGANIYGTATTEIHAGLFKQVFGGSNQYGSINTVNLNIDKDPYCDQMILESFCGGNEADMVGTDINATIQCSDIIIGALYGGSNKAHILKDGSGNGGNVTLTVLGGNYDYVFGGSKGVAGTPANIAGNVTLNLHGGTIHEAAFGGSDVSGNILGNIIVNVLDTVTACPLTVDTIYGGGRDAAYTPANANAVSPAVNVQHCTVESVFGGGKGSTAIVTANPQVIIGETGTINDAHGNPINTIAIVTGDVYGGGDAANVNGTATVLVQKCNSSAKYVYGGGNAADVNGTRIYIRGGEIDTIFGGGHGNNDPSHLTVANVNGNDTIAITGGKVGKAFAGSNLNGTISGRMSLNVAKSEPATCDLMVGEVYGGGNMAAGKAGTITIGCTGTWTTSGANNHNNHNATTNRIGYELEGVGTVYGGANQADIGTNANHSNIVLNIKEGIVENVYGGNNTSGDIHGTIQVNIDSLGTCGANHWYVGNVYGGGNQAPYTGTPDVNLLHGTVSGSVFGGGNEAGVGGGNVAMSGGNVLGGVYGGCNTSGVVGGNINVNVTGGTIGSSTNLAGYTTTDVFGGGYGAGTSTTGNVTVTINGSGVNVYGDVYGGSAFGSVNTNDRNTTTVNIQNGTLHSEEETVSGFTVYHGGNVFGGGLGLSGDHNKGIVNGEIEVNIGDGTPSLSNEGDDFTGSATIEGNVYGCNNTYGSPQANVTVNVYRTAQTAGVNTFDDPGYALNDVFGGGNEAPYTATGMTATVNVYGCHNTIRRVFGGGNAAAAPHVLTNIQGGHVYQVFGGGNGEKGSAHGADITEGIDLQIHGGNVVQFFGGSNQNGNIQGGINTVVDNNGPCGMEIEEFFCGGNFADINGNVETTLTCSEGKMVKNLYGGCNQANISGHVILNVEGGIYTNVFGGSKGDLASLGTGHTNKPANIGGNVTLNLYGGTIDTVYGGSNVNGNIGGIITVNVMDNESECPLNIGHIYGGSNLTSYTPTYTPTPGSARISPIVNVMHIRNGISGNVYGGSRGKEGVTTEVNAHPLVNIGYDAATMEQYIPENASHQNLYTVPNPSRAIVSGHVFGGGDAATVNGNTEVRIWNRAKVFGNVYGGGNMGPVTGDTNVMVDGAIE